MSEDTRYNGWTNRETWVYGLWNDGDANAEAAQEAYNAASADTFFTRKERARLDLADMLKTQFDDYLESEGAPSTGLVADLLSGAVGAINWQEIAESVMSDVDTSEEAVDEDTEDAA